MAWSNQAPTEREATLDKFCQTSCGQTYTNTLLAFRRGCNPPTPKGDGGAIVQSGPNSWPGKSSNHPAEMALHDPM